MRFTPVCEPAIFNLWNRIRSKNEYILSPGNVGAQRFCLRKGVLYLTTLNDDWKEIEVLIFSMSQERCSNLPQLLSKSQMLAALPDNLGTLKVFFQSFPFSAKPIYNRKPYMCQLIGLEGLGGGGFEAEEVGSYSYSCPPPVRIPQVTRRHLDLGLRAY